MPRIRVGPRMVEHELAVSWSSGSPEWRRPGCCLPEREVPGLPAPVLAQATVLFKPGKEGVADEGVAAVVQASQSVAAMDCRSRESGGRHGEG